MSSQPVLYCVLAIENDLVSVCYFEDFLEI